jgi:hypothetical protein
MIAPTFNKHEAPPSEDGGPALSWSAWMMQARMHATLGTFVERLKKRATSRSVTDEWNIRGLRLFGL